MKIMCRFFLIALAFGLSFCADDGAMKGSLTLSITDSPIDADNVKGVNIFINSVNAKSGGEWKSLKTFDQAVGINLTEYSGGHAYTLIDQYIDAGKFTALRFNLNLADLNSSLILSPQCNVLFADGSTKPIYFFESAPSNVIVTQELIVNSRGHVDFTFDVDVRKSLTMDDLGNYIFKPVIRTIETAKAGHIQATVTNYNVTDRLVVFAYPSGQFSPSETTPPSAGEVRFKNAITSFKIANGKFGLGFLPAGNYDLVFAKHSGSGEFLSVLGRYDGVTVIATETVQLEIDLTKLSGS